MTAALRQGCSQTTDGDRRRRSRNARPRVGCVERAPPL